MALASNGAGINFTRHNDVAGFNIYGEVISNSSSNPNISANAYWDNSYPILVNGDIFTRTQTNQSVQPASGYSTKQISQPIEDPCIDDIEIPTFPSSCNYRTCPSFDSTLLNCVTGLTHKIPPGTYSWINIDARKMDHANQGIISTCKYRMEGVYKITGGLSISVQGVRGGVDATNAVFLFGPNASQISIDMREQENKETPDNRVVSQAPTKGAWKGILFYQPTGNLHFNGINMCHASNIVSMDGLTYAPKGNVWINKNGSPGATLVLGNIIAKDMSLVTNNGSNTLIRPASMESVCSIGPGGGEEPSPTRRKRSRLIK